MKDLTDLCTAGELGALYHGKNVGGNVTLNGGALIKVATGAVYIAVYTAINMHFAGANVALKVSSFTDGNLTGYGRDFTLYTTIHEHNILEGDGTDNLNTGGEYVRSIAHNLIWGIED